MVECDDFLHGYFLYCTYIHFDERGGLMVETGTLLCVWGKYVVILKGVT